MSDERGGRYFREARFFLAGDKVVAQSHILEARSLMGYMRDHHALGGPPIQVKYTTLKDGTQIKATMMNGQYQAQIVSMPVPVFEHDFHNYEIWVRPIYSEVAFEAGAPYPEGEYDWLSDAADGCLFITEHALPKLYSNRMWQAPDKSIYCIVGGYDKSKYTGAAGTLISRDGEALVSATGIVGVGVFQGHLVMVTHVMTTPTISTIERDQVVYTVYVDGVVKLVTPTIDAYVDGGYGRGMNLAGTLVTDYGFSQNIVVFNTDASEGSCVLGNATRLVFHVLTDEFGAVVVTHELVTIPGADYMYTAVEGAVRTTVRTCTKVGSLVSKTYSDHLDSSEAGEHYTVALLCDYVAQEGGSEEIVYLLMLCRDTGSLRESWRYEHDAQAIEVCGFFGCEPTEIVQTVDTWDERVNRKDYTLQLSTGETIRRFGTWYESTGTRLTTQTAGVNRDNLYNDTFTVLAVDVKYGFILTIEDAVESYLATVETWDGPESGGPSVRVTTALQYPVAEPVLTRFSAGFVPTLRAFEYGDVPVLVTTTTNEYMEPETFGSTICDPDIDTYSDTRAYSTPARTDSKLRPSLLMYADPFYNDATNSCGLVVPSDSGVWDRAVVFISRPSAPAEAHTICASGGSVNVTDQFSDPLRAYDAPITRHFGVVYNPIQKKGT